jgi:hypothetical protein
VRVLPIEGYEVEEIPALITASREGRECFLSKLTVSFAHASSDAQAELKPLPDGGSEGRANGFMRHPASASVRWRHSVVPGQSLGRQDLAGREFVRDRCSNSSLFLSLWSSWVLRPFAWVNRRCDGCKRERSYDAGTQGGSDQLPLTHEFLAFMLAVRRAGVTVATGTLQQAGFIRNRRGIVTSRDTEGLEEVSCECYRLIRSRKRHCWLICRRKIACRRHLRPTQYVFVLSAGDGFPRLGRLRDAGAPPD